MTEKKEAMALSELQQKAAEALHRFEELRGFL
jgi:hypothetical protein